MIKIHTDAGYGLFSSGARCFVSIGDSDRGVRVRLDAVLRAAVRATPWDVARPKSAHEPAESHGNTASGHLRRDNNKHAGWDQNKNKVPPAAREPLNIAVPVRSRKPRPAAAVRVDKPTHNWGNSSNRPDMPGRNNIRKDRDRAVVRLPHQCHAIGIPQRRCYSQPEQR